MAIEIEIKLKVEHLAPIRDRLKQLGAARAVEVMETNIFFDTTDRELLASDRGLRLRRSRDIISGSERLALTFKGPRAEGPLKRREEIEIVVDHEEATTQLLARLGYERVLIFEKRRESWQLGDCQVELDALPELGSFVEIECPTEADVLRVREELGLAKVEGVVQTYPDLVAHHLSDRGAGETSLRFVPAP